MNRRIVVTGVDGFIGSVVASRLQAHTGFDVFGLDNGQARKGLCPASLKRVDNLDIRRTMDLEQYAKEVRPDAVVHLAALASAPACDEDLALASTCNATGTRNVAMAFAGICDTLVYSSSAAVYGNGHGVNEASPTNVSLGAYARTKRMGELYVERAEIPNRYVLRFANVYGPNSAAVLNAWADAIVGDRQLELHGDGGQTRDFIHVTDIAAAIANFVSGPVAFAPNGTYNVSTGTFVSIAEALAEIVRAAFPDLSDGQRSALMKHRVTRLPARPGDIYDSSLDPSKIKSLGWMPTISVQRGIEMLVNDARARKVHSCGLDPAKPAGVLPQGKRVHEAC